MSVLKMREIVLSIRAARARGMSVEDIAIALAQPVETVKTILATFGVGKEPDSDILKG